MFKWINELLEIKLNYIERKKSLINCESCDTLKMQLAIANAEKKDLLNRMLTLSTETRPVDTTELKPILPRNTGLNWRARQQSLEAESRREAQILNQRKEEINKVTSISTEELEKELDIVESERSAGANNV